MRRFSILPLFILILPAFITGSILSFSGNWTDGIRLGVLSLPGCALFYWALKTRKAILYLISYFWWVICWLDSSLRAISWFLFDSDTDAYFIVQAIANTNSKEVLEFFELHFITTILFSVVFLGIFITYFIFAKRYLSRYISVLGQPKLARYLIILCCILTVVAYVMRPSRILHPISFWTNYYQKIQKFKDDIYKHDAIHHHWDNAAQQRLTFLKNFTKRQTHVLAISESITSFNFGVCGYPRNTTPELQKRIHELHIFCKAYSPYASTINSLKVNLTDSSSSDPNDEPDESLMAYAKAAGFKIYWLSNQDDTYISSLFGNFANQVLYVNTRSGRSSFSLDEQLLSAYEQAINDPYPKKLIILHLIGAHPNYENRFPHRFDHFNAETNDQIESNLEQKNIDMWVQKQRNNYDNAILYQDWLIGNLLDTLQAKTHLGQRSFVFLSDHGNEVGHVLNYAGHSPTTEAGYRVPVIMWYDQIQNVGVDHHTIINTADLDLNMMHLMGIWDKEDKIPYFWTDSDYQFVPIRNWPFWQKRTS